MQESRPFYYRRGDPRCANPTGKKHALKPKMGLRSGAVHLEAYFDIPGRDPTSCDLCYPAGEVVSRLETAPFQPEQR